MHWAVKLKVKSKNNRIVILDIWRGLAIIGVVIYHFAFDLRLLEFIQTDVTQHLPWVVFARVLAGSFLMLTGISLVLAHGEGVRWRVFFLRVFIISGAALLISIATFFAYPDMFVYFGILHAIALFSILALPFLIVPLWLVSISAVLVLSLPFVYSNPFFNDKIFSWIGFWQTPPFTADLVPIFPAFGATLLGVFFARTILKYNLFKNISNISFKGVWVRFLKFASKWSLLIYLVHQPILLAILYPVAAIVKPAELTKQQAFYEACFGSCINISGSAINCTAYCQCSKEQVEQGDLWEIITQPVLTKWQSQTISSISKLCRAISQD